MLNWDDPLTAAKPELKGPAKVPPIADLAAEPEVRDPAWFELEAGPRPGPAVQARDANAHVRPGQGVVSEIEDRAVV